MTALWSLRERGHAMRSCKLIREEVAIWEVVGVPEPFFVCIDMHIQ